VLSVGDCGLEVLGIIQLLHAREENEEFAPIVAIVISENFCVEPIPVDFVWPPALYSVLAPGIQWGGENFQRFWDAFMSSEHDQLRLAVGNANLSQAQWKSFFLNCADHTSLHLESLDWSNNPLDPRFFDFVDESVGLHDLTLNGCARRGDPLFPVLLEFIRYSSTISDLCIAANLESRLSLPELRDLFLAVQENQSLSRLTASHYYAGSELLLFIGDVLMENRRITYVDIDVNNFHDIEVWREVFHRFGTRGVPLEIRWPTVDFGAIVETNSASPHALHEFRSLYDVIALGDRNIPVPEPTVTRRSGSRRPTFGMLPSPWGSGRGFVDLGSSAGLSVLFTDMDALNGAEFADALLPVDPIPPVDNTYVTKLFDNEFDPVRMAAAIRA
jgi:hypothetical protein